MKWIDIESIQETYVLMGIEAIWIGEVPGCTEADKCARSWKYLYKGGEELGGVSNSAED